ncbi:MAG: hypothetical protein ACRCUH_10210 [Shewanella sp.]
MARVFIGYSACPLTRQAFEAHGHEVWTCDLLPARDLAMFHHQCDVWEALENRGPWDFAVLHPMCTYLTVSAAWAFGDGPYHQKVKPGTLVGAARREARDEALENFKRLLALPFPVAIENPAPSFLNKAVGRPAQVIHPHQFGDDASKSTGLWLSEGVPLLVPTKSVDPRMVGNLPRWANQTDSGQNRLSPGANRWLERSATYPGIASAMGDQWGRWLCAN